MLSLSPEAVQTIFSLLPSTLQHTQVKVALCQTYLTRLNDDKPVRRPAPRAAPRPQPARSRQPSTQDPSLTPSTSTESSAPSVARKFPTVSTSEVIQLVSSVEIPSSAEESRSALTLQIKLQLIGAFGTLQEQLAQKDSDWTRALQSGELSRAIEQGFTPAEHDPSDVLTLAQDLKAILAVMGWYR